MAASEANCSRVIALQRTALKLQLQVVFSSTLFTAGWCHDR